MMRSRIAIVLFSVLSCSAASAVAAPRSKAPSSPPAAKAASATRHPVANELTELARTALASSQVRLPKGATLIAARPSTTSNVEIPIAPTRITIDLTRPARRAGPITATAVLVFWKDADVSARVPLRLDLSVPPESLTYDVPKGGVVTLVVRRGLVEVSAPAVASADADVGDVVQVLLRPSGRALRARIVAKGRALAVEDGR